MMHTFAGLGASRAEVEAIFMRDLSRESFIVRPYESKGNYSMAHGRFRWDAKNVFFDFYGQGKLRTITVLRSAVEGFAPGAIGTFAPDKTRWEGAVTEFVGTAHRNFATKMWERAAWNTVNEWCTPQGRAVYVPLIEVMKVAAKAWARVTDDAKTVWFLPHEKGARHEVVVKDADRDHVYQKFFVVQAATAMRHATVSEPGWWNLRAASQEQLDYLAVAYDQFEESGGKSFAPLQGLLKLKREC